MTGIAERVDPSGHAGRGAPVLTEHRLPVTRDAGPVAGSGQRVRIGHQIPLARHQQRRLAELLVEQIRDVAGPRQRLARPEPDQQPRVHHRRERHPTDRAGGGPEQRPHYGRDQIGARAHRLREHMLRAVAARLRKQFSELIVAAAETATCHFAGRLRASQVRGVDQQCALVVGDHGRRLATLPQQLARAADRRGLAAAQEPADQMDRHGRHGIRPGECQTAQPECRVSRWREH